MVLTEKERKELKLQLRPVVKRMLDEQPVATATANAMRKYPDLTWSELAGLIDFAVEAWTHPASPFINGFPAGQESHPRAIVMFETGDVRCVHVNAVQVIGAEGLFSE